MKLTKQLNQLLDDLNSQQWIKDLKMHYPVYAVGGCVRDGFLKKQIKDIDLVVENISIVNLIDFLKEYGTVNLVGESFSVIKFKPLDDYEGECFDIAIPRVDRKIDNGHRGFKVVTENVTILDDLKRRDITINSIAINVLTKELLDPFNGLKDLKNKIIRATDINAFVEDSLRLFRCVQFSSRFNFIVEPVTKSLMKENAHLIDEISG
jgi:tRNA nucleotidyltransferase (CCA-adding enzyme)